MTIFERIPIGDIFGKTPLKPLHRHIRQVKECADQLKPLVGAFISGDYEKIEEIANNISRLEHTADETKTDIRLHFPRNWFMPVDRSFFTPRNAILQSLAHQAHDEF